jgi:hypothetical protein
MQKLLSVLAFLVFTSLPLMAQDFSKVDVFGGYQFSRLGSEITLVPNANGFDGSVTYNVNKKFGLEGDFNGAYQSYNSVVAAELGEATGVNVPAHFFTYSGGPVVSFRSKSRVTPFAHVMVGGARRSIAASASGVSVSIPSNGYAITAGGGLDMKVAKHVSIRLVQVDWVDYHFGSLLGVSGTGTSSAANFKLATGIVFNLGGK